MAILEITGKDNADGGEERNRNEGFKKIVHKMCESLCGLDHGGGGAVSGVAEIVTTPVGAGFSQRAETRAACEASSCLNSWG